MDADGLPIVGTGVDYTQVGPIHQKKTLALFNNFVLRSVQFLNKFSGVCEEKLEDLNTRLQRMEAALSILEAKLSSIPGLESVEDAEKTPVDEVPKPEEKVDIPQDTSKDSDKVKEEVVNVDETKPKNTVAQDPRYAKYLKMVHVGVPVDALRPKMLAEGLNPDLLQTPDAVLPTSAAEPIATRSRDSDSDDGDLSSDFSD